MKDLSPPAWLFLGILAVGIWALFGLWLFRDTTPAAAPVQQDPPILNMCKRQTLLADCLRNHPEAAEACERDATRQAWTPQSQVSPPCRGMV